MTEHLIMLVGLVVVGLWWFIAWQLSKEEAELPLFGPDDDRPEILNPERRLTRHERLQMMADSGCDTWEEYRGER